MLAIIISFISGIFFTLLTIKSKKAFTQKSFDPLEETVEDSELIQDELDRIIKKFKADRVWIAQFHNGGHFYPTGKSIQKFSIIFEETKSPKNQIRRHLQNIPVNLFSRFLNELFKKREIVIQDYRDPNISTFGLKGIADENKTKSSYLFSLTSRDSRMIGVLGIEYTSDRVDLSEFNLIELRVESAKIGAMLIEHLSS
jgi:hypothetical protein